LKKSDNEWEIIENKYDSSEGKWYRTIEINEEHYRVLDENSALVHAILLLVDVINDKKL